MRLTPAEWKLMNAVWRGYPVTTRGIADRLAANEGWAYTTIKTMLSRLVSKGILKERKEGKTSLYEPLLYRKRARAQALAALAVDAFDGAFGNLMHFLVEEKDLSEEDRNELIRMLQRDKKSGGQKQ